MKDQHQNKKKRSCLLKYNPKSSRKNSKIDTIESNDNAHKGAIWDGYRLQNIVKLDLRQIKIILETWVHCPMTPFIVSKCMLTYSNPIPTYNYSLQVVSEL